MTHTPPLPLMCFLLSLTAVVLVVRALQCSVACALFVHGLCSNLFSKALSISGAGAPPWWSPLVRPLPLSHTCLLVWHGFVKHFGCEIASLDWPQGACGCDPSYGWHQCRRCVLVNVAASWD